MICTWTVDNVQHTIDWTGWTCDGWMRCEQPQAGRPGSGRPATRQPFMPPPREVTIAAASARSQGRAFARASIGLIVVGAANARGTAATQARTALLVGAAARATGISHPAIVPGSIAQSIARARGRAGPRAGGIDHVLIVRKRLAAQRLLGLM